MLKRRRAKKSANKANVKKSDGDSVAPLANGQERPIGTTAAIRPEGKPQSGSGGRVVASLVVPEAEHAHRHLSPLQGVRRPPSTDLKEGFESISTNYGTSPYQIPPEKLLQESDHGAGSRTMLTPLKRKAHLDDFLPDSLFATPLRSEVARAGSRSDMRAEAASQSGSPPKQLADPTKVASVARSVPVPPSPSTPHLAMPVQVVLGLRAHSTENAAQATKSALHELDTEVARLLKGVSTLQGGFHSSVDLLHRDLQDGLTESLISIAKTRIPQVYFALLPRPYRTGVSIAANIGGMRRLDIIRSASSSATGTHPEQRLHWDDRQTVTTTTAAAAASRDRGTGYAAPGRASETSNSLLQSISSAFSNTAASFDSLEEAPINPRFSEIMTREIRSVIEETVDRAVATFRKGLFEHVSTFGQQLSGLRERSVQLGNHMLDLAMLCEQCTKKLADVQKHYGECRTKCSNLQVKLEEKNQRLALLQEQLRRRTEIIDDMRQSFYRELNSVKIRRYENEKDLIEMRSNAGSPCSPNPMDRLSSGRPRSLSAALQEYPLGRFTMEYLQRGHRDRDAMKEAAKQMEDQMNKHIRAVTDRFQRERQRMEQKHIVELERQQMEIDTLRRQLAIVQREAVYRSGVYRADNAH